jgi:hypothetical protein
MDDVLQWKHKCTAVLTCNKGCGTQIYFDPNNKSASGKMIPMEQINVLASSWKSLFEDCFRSKHIRTMINSPVVIRGHRLSTIAIGAAGAAGGVTLGSSYISGAATSGAAVRSG